MLIVCYHRCRNKQELDNIIHVSLALLLTFLPSFIQHNYKIYLPVELEFIVTVFIYASLVLGEIHEYYTRYWWWDLILHSTAGVTFGLLGFFIMYILHRERKIATSPILIALFFSFGSRHW